MSLSLDQYTVTRNDYVQGDLINKGFIGNVYEGVWKTRPVAVKVFCLTTLPPHYDQEVYPYFQIKHPNILPIFAINKSVNQFSFLMEKMETSLAKKIEILVSQGLEFDLNQVEHIAESVANALSHLHENKIIHKHLKPTNILFNDKNEIKVSDFAFSQIRMDTENSKLTQGEQSICWRAPESVSNGSKLTPSRDVYSFGMILWQMFAMKNPYADASKQDVIKLFGKSIQEEIPKNCPPVWANLIQKCWALNPAERPTMQQVKAEIIEIKKARKNVSILKEMFPEIKDNIPNIQYYIEGCISHSLESNK